MARGDAGSKKGSGGFKLFGVEINVGEELHNKSSSDESLNVVVVQKKKRVHVDEGDDDRLRKSKSMGNLHEMMCNQSGVADGSGSGSGSAAADSGYHSDGVLHLSSRRAAHMRRRGKAWSADEHRSFLAGLTKLGRGDWKGISKNYVRSRTPTQVASHAQKYFIRKTTTEKKNRRASLFDIPFKKPSLPPQTPAAPSNGSKVSQLVVETAVAPVKRTGDIRRVEWSTSHAAPSEKKPPLPPMSRNFAQDAGHVPYMVGVPRQSFPAAPVMPQAESYPMMNHTVSPYPNYYFVPTSHGNFRAPFVSLKPNGVLLQHYPPLYVTSQARPATPVGGRFATSAPVPNYYHTVTGPSTGFAVCAPIPNQYPTANGPATSFAACASFPSHYPTANGPAASTAKKDGLKAGVGTMST